MRPLILAMTAWALGLHATGGIGSGLRFFAVGSVGPILRELAPEFERATGHRVEFLASTSGATPGQPLVADYRAGAGGRVAAATTAKSSPRGH